MIEQTDEMDAALEAASRWASQAASAARSALSDPWRIALIGRVGAGKTTAVNRMSGEEHPVGLGGVTRAVHEVSIDGAVLIDTPGIDGLDSAIAALADAVATADVLLWIVDGLQPATRTERDLLAALALPTTVVHAWISRLDLVDSDQHDAIVERVAALVPAPPQGGDLRAWDGTLPKPLWPKATSARRKALVDHALRSALDALDALPPLEGRAALGRRLATRWRERVRGVVDLALAELVPGQLAVTRRFQERLYQLATEARDGFLSELGDEPTLIPALSIGPPKLELPAFAPPDALGVVAAAMGGEHRARVHIREQGGRWLTDGLLALAEWIEQAPDLDLAQQQRDDDRDRLLRALATTS